jgi:hypothetical protein
MKQCIFAILAFLTWASGTLAAEEKPWKLVTLKPAEFEQCYPVHSVVTNQSRNLTQDQKPVSSPQKTRQFLLSEFFDNAKPYGEWRGEVLIFDDNKPKWRLQAHDFKHFRAEWVTEDIIKIEVWPGRIVQLIELINVETGNVLYRSASQFLQIPD